MVVQITGLRTTPREHRLHNRLSEKRLQTLL